VTSSSPMRAGLTKALVYSMLSFFFIPGITYAFVSYASHRMDSDYNAKIQETIKSLPAASQSQVHLPPPPSKWCDIQPTDEQSKKQIAQLCEPYGTVWQFHIAGLAASWMMVFGAAVFAGIFILAGVAFLSSRAPALSFLFGWRFLIAASTIEVIAQGVFATWLSFWITVYFFEVYIPKIIIVVAILAGGAALYAVIWMFKKVQPKNEVSGELLSAEREPRLWARVRALAAKVGTAPPDHIVAGIDSNFFVTQAPLTLNGRQLDGRILYISLPLLRILDQTEADAVLAHELAHFRGGDTKWSSLLGPKLTQFDLYGLMMQLKGVFLAVHILRLYRMLFEFALKRGSRRREFIADGTAAQIVSGEALIRSLIKFAGYTSYRREVESQLFAQDQRHQAALGIASQVAAGLTPYAASSQFIENMRRADIPHPFDSHPSLADRMKNVGHAVEERDYLKIITASPYKTWAQEIAAIDEVEAGLWGQYEQIFKAEHERALAYRYRPSSEEERAIVLKYFPAAEFSLRGGKTIIITYEGILLPEPAKGMVTDLLPWNQVATLTLADSNFGAKRLVIGHPKSSKTEVRLSGLKNLEAFKSTLTAYWQRHQIMTQATSAQASPPA
jgi:Zn-dependent protease with chaperone function